MRRSERVCCAVIAQESQKSWDPSRQAPVFRAGRKTILPPLWDPAGNGSITTIRHRRVADREPDSGQVVVPTSLPEEISIDPRHFDRLARSLTTAASRRSALVGLVAALFSPFAPDFDAEAKRRRRRGKGSAPRQ
jgi:hypothetical protein